MKQLWRQKTTLAKSKSSMNSFLMLISLLRRLLASYKASGISIIITINRGTWKNNEFEILDDTRIFAFLSNEANPDQPHFRKIQQSVISMFRVFIACRDNTDVISESKPENSITQFLPREQFSCESDSWLIGQLDMGEELQTTILRNE